MVLSAIGEQISPSTIEVLSGVGLGAHWLEEQKLIFFSLGHPDEGVSSALGMLGFSFVEKASSDDDPPPFEQLRADLTRSPAILGPLDMGYLRYVPFHRAAAGADHFVVALQMDDGMIRLHDPAGYPLVSLPIEDMAQAWKAERIGYRRGRYRYWTSLKRERQPSEEEIYGNALSHFQRVYQAGEGLQQALNGSAITAAADYFGSGAPSGRALGHAGDFAFKLGAKRALDFAAFFEERDTTLAELKKGQGELFGACHTLAVAGSWSRLAGSLRELAEVEETFRTALLSR